MICEEETAVAANPAGTVGGVAGEAFTVKLAALLVALPAVLLTSTVNVEPLSEVAVAGVV